MPTIVTRHCVDAEGLARLREPRHDVVVERADGTDRFAALTGPFSSYLRRLEPDGDAVVETIQFRLAVPFWWFIFVLPYRRALRRPPAARHPWWAPPEALDARAARSLGLLCGLTLIAGYLGTLVTQTITYAADEFGSGRTAEGVTLAAARLGVIITLAAGVIADRRGRARVLTAIATAGCLLAVTGALAPNLAWLGASQSLSRGCAGALGMLIVVMAAEEVPAGSRAYAVSLLTMTGALGAGMCLWVLPVADLGDSAWRLVYLPPLLFLPLALRAGRALPESRRFVAPHAEAHIRGHGARFALLAVAGFLLSLFTAPVSQFQNDFLRDERAFSAAALSVFMVVTSTPGAIGIVAGGHLADLRGRRLIGAGGIVGGTVFTVAMFFTDGWAMWTAAAVGSIAAGLTVPAMRVYGPELFPTGARGQAGGAIDVIALIGSATGLILGGYLADQWDFGPPMALLALGPLAVAVLVILRFPETAHRSLEDLNPEDAATGAPALDH